MSKFIHVWITTLGVYALDLGLTMLPLVLSRLWQMVPKRYLVLGVVNGATARSSKILKDT